MLTAYRLSEKGLEEVLTTGPAELPADVAWVDLHQPSLDEDRTAEAAGPPAPGALTPAPVFGAGFVERIGNNIAAAMAGILAPVLIVARAS